MTKKNEKYKHINGVHYNFEKSNNLHKIKGNFRLHSRFLQKNRTVFYILELSSNYMLQETTLTEVFFSGRCATFVFWNMGSRA